jgi:hypothetical protein
MRDAVSVTVPRPIYNKIRARLKPYQAMAGALQELIEQAERYEACIKAHPELADKYSPIPKPTEIPKPQEPPKIELVLKKVTLEEPPEQNTPTALTVVKENNNNS